MLHPLKAALCALSLTAAPYFAPSGTQAQTRLSTGAPAERRYSPAGESPRRLDVPIALHLSLENDDLFFGGYGRLFPELDGTDTGRTHATAIEATHTTDEGISITLRADTRLFTHLNGNNRDGLIGQNFNEESSFRLVVDSLLGGNGLYWTMGAGALVLNGSDITIGGTGQQDGYHRSVHSYEPNQILYAYDPDGRGIRLALTAEAGLGLLGIIAEAPAAGLVIQVQTMGRVATLWDATGLFNSGSLQLRLGGRDSPGYYFLRLEGIQEVNLYVNAPGPELVTRARVAMEWDWGQVYGEIAAYYGDPILQVHVYNFNNRTMSFGILLRAQ